MTVAELRAALNAIGPEHDHRMIKLDLELCIPEDVWPEGVFYVTGMGQIENKKCHVTHCDDSYNLDVGYAG
jgi:hypothetical protein